MSNTVVIKTVKDQCTVTINETDLTEKKVGDALESPKRNVPCSNELQWWITWYPAGSKTESKKWISVFIYVSSAVAAYATFTIDGTDIKKTFSHSLKVTSNRGFSTFVSHSKLRPFFRDGKVSLTCSVDFQISFPLSLAKHSIFQSCEDLPTDCELVVENRGIQVHKHLLALVAPGLYANFSHNTIEARTGSIVITDFDYDTVKAAMDYFYGHELVDTSIERVIGILRFVNKYNVNSVELESVPASNITEDSFCTIAHYAYDCCKDSLLTECSNFFKDHQDQLKTTEKFAQLPPAAIVSILESAFSLSDSYEILLYALKNNIPRVVDYLEMPLFKSLSLATFCEVTRYAWNNSREELKKTCAEFFYDNRGDITIMEDFIELGNTAISVMKLSWTLKNEFTSFLLTFDES